MYTGTPFYVECQKHGIKKAANSFDTIIRDFNKYCDVFLNYCRKKPCSIFQALSRAAQLTER